MSTEPTTTEILEKVVETIEAVQDAEETVVREGKRLTDHMNDPNAHGRDVEDLVSTQVSDHNADPAAHGQLARKTTRIVAGAGLNGGGDLSADRTLTVKYGTAAGTACQGNDARLGDARTPKAHKATHKTGGTDALTPADIGAVPIARKVVAGTGLSGGGDLSADRTLTVKYGTAAGTACQGNDARLSDARTPKTHTHAATDITGLDLNQFNGVITEKFQNLGRVSGTVNVNLSAGNYIIATIGGATTFTLSGVVTNACNTVLFELTNGGSAALTWGMKPKWPGGAAPVLTAAGVDLIAMVTRDNGAVWRGVCVGTNLK